MKTLAVLLLTAATAVPQSLDPFTPLLGQWEAEGQFLGAKATARYEWQRTLANRFVTLRYQAIRDGQTVFAGHAYYRADGSGTWHDSEGHIYSLTWKATAKGVATAWGEGGTSDYEAGGPVTDRMKGKPFVTFTLRR
jgi:hypothetical protein